MDVENLGGARVLQHEEDPAVGGTGSFDRKTPEIIHSWSSLVYISKQKVMVQYFTDFPPNSCLRLYTRTSSPDNRDTPPSRLSAACVFL